MADKEPEIRKYRIKNIENGPVFIKEMRKTVSVGKEAEFVGIITAGTKRLEEKGFITIKDLGIASEEDIPKRRAWPDPLQRKAFQEKKEQELTKAVREKLAEIKKPEESKAKVEEVSASEMGLGEAKEATKPPPVPELPAEEEEDKPKTKVKAKGKIKLKKDPD